MHLYFTNSAQKDLLRLREFIAAKNPVAANKISQRLRNSIKNLVDQPGMGVSVEGFDTYKT